ncbi:MAG: hypothetical protein WCE48_09375 [Steroidobacteraceae bacterium]
MDAVGTSLMVIFATPFASVQLSVSEELNSQLQRLLETRATDEYRAAGVRGNPLYFRSREDLLEWPDAPVQSLKQQMLGAVAAIVAATNMYSEKEFGDLRMQARGWFSLVRPNGCIPAASYPQTSWCAIYCVAAPEPAPDRADSAMLRLYETRLANAFTDASTWRMRPPFAYGHHTWRPTRGYMAVFPAAVAHEIALLRGAGSLLLVTLRVRFATPFQASMPSW